MGTKQSWLEVLKGTIEEKPQLPREDSGKSKAATVRNVQKLRETEHEAGGEVVDLGVARTLRSEDERSLPAADWSPKERCGPLGLTIWANPETGYCCSQDVALHRLANPLTVPLLEAFDCTRGKREDTVSIHAAISREREVRALALLEGPSPNLAKPTP